MLEDESRWKESAGGTVVVQLNEEKAADVLLFVTAIKPSFDPRSFDGIVIFTSFYL